MNDIQKMIKGLLTSGLSKWRISKEIGVHWNTIRSWELGKFSPSKNSKYKGLEKLKELFKNKCLGTGSRTN